MRKIKLSLFLMLLAGFIALAQKPKKNKNYIFVSNDYRQVGSGKVLLKFFSDQLKYEQGYNIYRKKEGTTNLVKINKQPIAFLKSLPSSLKLEGEYAEFYANLSKFSSETINKQGLGKAMVKLRAVQNFDFAYAIGNGFIDSAAVKGESYQYILRRINTGTDVLMATSSTIKVEDWKPLPEPQDIKFDKKREGVKFSWLHLPQSFLGVDVFRKAANSKDFKKLNDVAIYPQMGENGKYPKYYYTDVSASNDTVYQYKFVAVDYFGQASLFSPEITVGKKDFEPPFPPDSVQLDVDTLRIKLKWKAPNSPDLSGYHVYRSLKYDKGFEKVTSKTISKKTTNFIDVVPKINEYFYQIASVDSSGNEGFSQAIMADVRDVVAPETPKDFIVALENGKIILTWSASPDKDLKGYFVYKAPAGATDFVILNGKPFKETRFEIAYSKASKTKFVYRILAIDSNFNRSRFTPLLTLQLPDIQAPAQPFIKSIQVKNDFPEIIWMPNVDNDLKSYALIRMKYGKDTTKTVVKSDIGKTDTIYTDKTAETNEYYKYSLFAADSTGNISVSSTPYTFKNVNTNTILKVKKLAAKFDKKATEVKLNWTLETDKNFFGLVVFRSFDGEDMQQFSKKLIVETELIDKTAKKPGKYQYQLRIYDKLGNVVKSQMVEVVVAVGK
ncbi:MAG: hypothetical protein ACKVOU_04340 [Cytophagales bacterium]